MGYRSEVGILITLPKTSNVKSMLKKLFSKWKERDVKDCFEIKSFEEGDDKYVYAHSKCSLKWYSETYEDEKATMQFINKFGYKTGGIHFIRIGENYDDIEEIVVGEPQKYIHLERALYLL